MKTRFVIIGSQGQLGKELQGCLPQDQTICLSRTDADLTQFGAIAEKLKEINPDIVINCAAYNKVDQAEDEPMAAFAINARAAMEIAKAGGKFGFTLVHFSTDYVFGLEGFRNKPYLESDPPGPISTYGISKLTGEYLVRAYCPKHFIIRTCGLYGKHGVGGKGTNFIETMLRLAASGKPIKVVEDQICTPTSAKELARASVRLIEDCPFGLYHLTNSGQTSWHGFAQKIFELSRLSVDLLPTTTFEYASKATRPAYSVLASEHTSAPRLQGWDGALEEYLKERLR